MKPSGTVGPWTCRRGGEAWARSRAVSGCAVVAMAGMAIARQPLDVTAVKPAPATVASDALGPTGEDGSKYRVGRFVLRYRAEHEDLPAVDQLLDAPVRLGVTSAGFVAPREGGPSSVLRVGDVVEGTPGIFYRSALDEVRRAIVSELNRRGVIGVFVQMEPEDVDEAGDVDLRRGSSNLRMIVWTGKIRSVRTIGAGERIGKQGAVIDSPDPVHARIRTQSPVQEGDVARRDRIDDYLFRLNRHPGRRVDAALAPAGGPDNPEDVGLDYLVSESKPWSVYAQLSNTGTRQTSQWRERFGFVHNQLTKHDDTFRVDYVTAGFSTSQALTGSYEFPLLSDRVRFRVFGSYSEFDASNVGAAGEGFGGRTWQVGGEGSGTILQHHESFLDLFAGVRWENVRVTDNQLLPANEAVGQTNFVIPSLGLRFDRQTEIMSTTASLAIEGNISGIAGTDSEQLPRLGRRAVDDGWTAIKWDVSHSMFLEPLFDRASWLGRGSGGTFRQTLAHEVAASLRGQQALGARLIPNEEEVVGGLYSVRGYPESVSAGDSAIVASLEYRYHYPRGLAVSEPGFIGEKAMPRYKMLGENFRWAPQQPYGMADWDLVFKGFLDLGRTQTNSRLLGEFDNTLMGAGLGVEFQVKRNVSARLDWGVALSSVDESGGKVDAGSNRFHVVLTLLY